MALEVRRIVTGHDAKGKAIIASDERLVGEIRRGIGAQRYEIWSTDVSRRSLVDHGGG